MGNFKHIKKLGLGICCFDATELLRGILSEIHDLIDYTVVGVQKISYNGDPISLSDLHELYKLKDEGLINEIVELETNLNEKPRVQEKDKRNMLIDKCVSENCTHALIIDSDEFYNHGSFEKALKTIDDNDYEITYCQYINYYHDFKHAEKYPFPQGMFVPFVTKTKYRYDYDGHDFPKPSDPTRRYVRPKQKVKIFNKQTGKVEDREKYLVNYYEFQWKDLKMHHLSWIRANIRKKLNNWSSKTCFKDHEDLIDQAVEAFNNFNSNINNNVRVNVLFNVPDHAVEVYPLPKEYVHFNYDYKKELPIIPQEKKILMLILSSGDEKFLKLENAIRDSWVKEYMQKYPNITYYFYRGTDKKEPYTEGDIIYVPNDDSFIKTGSKFYDALKYCVETLHIKFDYFYRSNSSSFVNVPLLNKFISYLDNDSYMYCGNIYSAFWSKFNFYGGGECLLLRKQDVELFLNLFSKTGRFLEDKFKSADDNLISGLFNERNIFRLKIDHTKKLKALGVYRLPYKKIEYTENIFSYICVQVKNFYEAEERDFDSESDKIKFVTNLFVNKKFTDEDIDNQYKKLIDNIDQECFFMPKLKADYFQFVKENIEGKPESVFSKYRFSNKISKDKLREIIKHPPYNVLNIS